MHYHAKARSNWKFRKKPCSDRKCRVTFLNVSQLLSGLILSPKGWAPDKPSSLTRPLPASLGAFILLSLLFKSWDVFHFPRKNEVWSSAASASVWTLRQSRRKTSIDGGITYPAKLSALLEYDRPVSAGLRPSSWCKLGGGHQHRRSGRGQRGEGCFITGGHASHGLKRQVTML
jgi:hypothetical protein